VKIKQQASSGKVMRRNTPKNEKTVRMGNKKRREKIRLESRGNFQDGGTPILFGTQGDWIQRKVEKVIEKKKEL